MKRTLPALAGLTWLLLTGVAHARIEADPNKDYAVTPEAGPWMISATCYVGPEAPNLAHELVLEIRSRFDLPAWVFNKGDDERKEYIERWRKVQENLPVEARVPYRGPRIREQCAVLIGGYKDMATARRALDHVKSLSPPSSNRLMPFYSRVVPVKGSEDMGQVEGGFVNPFPNSFVMHNPTVPLERHADSKNDAFLKELNAGESLSLLKCEKPWTLVVATFQGASIYAPKEASNGFLASLFQNKALNTLGTTGDNAHNLAEFLRKSNAGGFKAYVLHLRSGSIVTVGGFDQKDDSQMQSMRRALAGIQFGPTVPILPEPFAIEVPRPK